MTVTEREQAPPSVSKPPLQQIGAGLYAIGQVRIRVEELAIAQGFQISDLELNEAKQKVDSASSRLAKLRDERNAALAKKKSLDEAQEKLLTTEAEIARLEEELARLKGTSPEKTADDNTGTKPATRLARPRP